MTETDLCLGGERLVLDAGGAVLWPARKLMAVADLHLEKGSAAAAKGSLLPPWDSAATLDRLARLLRRHRPEVTVLLGDSFHDRAGASRLGVAERERLGLMARATRLVWVLGNHDPEAPVGLPGEAVAEFELGGLVFRHQAQPGATEEISGHFHPKARIPTRGATVVRPCFVADPRRLILPALGAYTGGLDVQDRAIAALFPRGGRVFLLGQGRLFGFPYQGWAARDPLPAGQSALKL